MPVEAKPLFRPDVLRSRLASFTMPAVDASKLAHWAGEIASGRIGQFKEKEILPHFLQDVFVSLLGYVPPAGADRYTIRLEHHVPAVGTVADAVLGDFTGGGGRPVVALEGKGPADPLDRPHAGRKLSAVDQGYLYAVNLPCDWIVVTSIRQTRLYHKGSDQQTYERFDTTDLAADADTLRRFMFLLGADRVVPPTGECHLPGLFTESEKVGKELTKAFYVRYADIRQDAFETLSTDNPAVPRPAVLSATQKLLDRVIFVAFAEDRGLLPPESLKKAYEHADPYNPRPVWENFRGLFRSIDKGNPSLDVPAYNGGLFAPDAVLDGLTVTDTLCRYFKDLGDYDYSPAHEASGAEKIIDVEILGHIFEQSITDLEKLRSTIDGPTDAETSAKQKSRRKKEGAFYTPSFITRYILEQALGGVLADRFESLRIRHEHDAKGDALRALRDPTVYDLDKLSKPGRAGLVAFWEAWKDELATVRVLDPACGSGAFLIEAFDQLHAVYQACNTRLSELRGPQRLLYDLDKHILQNNLYGVDLNEEAIEICRLSLWIKTAARGKALTSLDKTVRVGNSVIADPAVHPRAVDWKATFPDVFKDGGFDVVVGNPPYVRQEWFSADKPYLQGAYKAYHGMADLYVYFYELGLNVLRPGGLLSFIVTNKWMKAGYGEPLRRLFSEAAWIESVVDFGHAKQIFEEADVFPSIIVARKPTTRPKPTTARLCTIPREQLRVDDLSRQIADEGADLPLNQLGASAWQLEPPAVLDLLQKLRRIGVPLAEFAGVKPLSGIKTGLNEAFLVDTATKDQLAKEDPACLSLLKPYLRGQDFTRWQAQWAGLWMIALGSSENIPWPWADAGEGAEEVFRSQYPTIHRHLTTFRGPLESRQDQGRYWWELRSCAYWAAFDGPKIMYPEMTWRSDWCIDHRGTLCNNTAYFIPTADPWIVAVANSPAAWWYSWRTAIHGKDEVLRFIKDFVQDLPIPPPTDGQRGEAAAAIEQLATIVADRQAAQASIEDWLRIEHQVEKPSKKLQAAAELDSDAFVAEVRKARGKANLLTSAGLKSLRDEYTATVEPARARAVEARQLERRLSDLVNAAYGQTSDEVALLWQTAPPRMPLGVDCIVSQAEASFSVDLQGDKT